MIFKCKNCGGNVLYNPERHAMVCPFCESEMSHERKDGEEKPLTDAQKSCICPNCGGEIKLENHTSATQCPYCDSYIIFNSRVEGEYLPKHIIPFQLGKENCKKAIRDRFKDMLFAPTDFLSEVRLNSMQGIYVPFWFYNYDISCDLEAEGTKVRTWTSGNRQYTETSYYNLVRNMDIDFREIPADASVAMPDDIMDLMAPYDYSRMIPFEPEYMSGFYAEKYNMPANLIESRAKSRLEGDTKKIMQGTCGGYSNVRIKKQNITAQKEWTEYGLIPVWKYIYNYKDKEYPFYVNGQTGKIIGTAPLSKAKVWVYAGTIWACLTLIMCLMNTILTVL